MKTGDAVRYSDAFIRACHPETIPWVASARGRVVRVWKHRVCGRDWAEVAWTDAAGYSSSGPASRLEVISDPDPKTNTADRVDRQEVP
jgi:hypothetical protein